VVSLNVLPGEPLDGTGKVCIHLFVADERGPFVEPCVIYPRLDAQGQRVGNELEYRPTRGRLACDHARRRAVVPTTRNGVTVVTPRTSDPRAVTCTKCAATAEYAELMSLIASAEAAR
jgi:hypothetical protein